MQTQEYLHISQEANNNVGDFKMAGKSELKKFSDISIDNTFFNSLKAGYSEYAKNIGFGKWFMKKAKAGSRALDLWNWQKSRAKEIYVTVFEKHDLLISKL